MKIDLIKNGRVFLGVSLVLVILSLICIFRLGLNFGIDFTGGTIIQYQFKSSYILNQNDLLLNSKSALCHVGGCNLTVSKVSNDTYQIQSSPLSTAQIISFENTIDKLYKNDLAQLQPISVSTIGPSVGTQLRQDSLQAILLVIVGIIIYIAWAFRKVPKPASSFTFGITAVIAMIHDMIIVIGVFSILGYFFNAPIDTLFVTALLTVIGFSVHDTIVVFDRIRENLKLNPSVSFTSVVNSSLMQTLTRSINTSLTVIITSLALFLLGGESIRWFVLALLIGLTSGTYSSIFVASQSLVLWQTWKHKNE